MSICKHPEYNNIIFTGRDEETSLEVLKYFKIKDFFEEMNFAEGIESDKYKMLEREKYTSQKTFYITDVVKEIEIVTNKGVIGILARWYRNVTFKKSHYYEISTIEELEEFINKMG